MSMPMDLVLVRHGESEGNVVTTAAKNGNVELYTEAFMTTPGSQWRLTDLGRAQAATIGSWFTAQFGTHVPETAFRRNLRALLCVPRRRPAGMFDRYYVSPYVRTRETAGTLALAGARWRINRALRERDWGDIGSMPREQFQSHPWYTESVLLKRIDPLYWVAPNGESLAMVAEDRVRNVLDTLHRECSRQRVLIVGHGELMWAFRLVLERLSDERFAELDEDRSERIHNCMALHYTRRDPVTGQVSGKLSWMRRAWPVRAEDGTWTVRESDWVRISFVELDNAALLSGVAGVRSLLAASSQTPATPSL